MAHPTRKTNTSEWIDLEVPNRLPIIPLVSSVLFPGGVLSLQVGIDRNVRLLKSLPEDQNLIAAFCQKSGDKENPKPEDLSQIGVLAAIVQRLPPSSDRYQLFLQGRQRVELVQLLQNEPYFEEGGFIQPVQHHNGSDKMATWPVRIDGKRIRLKGAPSLGGDSADVLESWLGIDAGEFANLKSGGVL